MSLPHVEIAKRNGTARPTASAASKALIIGPASSGIKENKLYTFANTSDVANQIGYGPAQEAAQLFLTLAPPGFGSVDVLVSSGSGTSINAISAASPTIVPTGTPYASYDLRVRVTQAGTSGSAKFVYSLDGGNTYTDDIRVPATNGTYAIPNTGLTLTFGAGTHAVGNSCHYDVQGPQMSTTHLANCISTLSNSNTNYTLILVADETVNPSSGSALFTAMDGHLTTLDNNQNKFTQAVVSIGGETKLFNRSYAGTEGDHVASDVVAEGQDLATSEGNFISLVAEKVNTYLASPMPGYARPRKPFAWIYAAVCHAVGSDISQNPAAIKMPRCETPSYDDYLDGSVYHDEKIVAPRSWPGEAGVFINQAKLKSAANSTYDIWPKGRVVSRAAEVVYAAIRPFIHTRVRVLGDGTGRIDPVDKVAIETAVNKQLRAALLTPINGQGFQGHCTDVLFSINGESNILSTGALEGTTLIVPFAYPSSATVNIYLTDTIAVDPAVQR